VSIATAIVDLHALVQLIYVAVLAGVAVCVAYALAVVGVTRSHEASTSGRRGTALLYRLLAAAGGLVCVCAVAAGAIVMTGS
jgi:hypothetical protein